MRQLELDENNNPNNATTVTIKSEALRPKIVQEKHGIDGYNGLSDVRSSFDKPISAPRDVDETSMSNLLQKYNN